MHLIIDIRSRHPEDAYIIRYAHNWVQKWRKFSPNDSYTFLIFEDQEAPEWEQFLRVRNTNWFHPNKKLKIIADNEILRTINFSRYQPYDPLIPTITHIFDMGRYFYDASVNSHILRRKEREFEIKKLVHHSSHLIVPNFFTGNELVELWNVGEEKIDIFPYLSFENIQNSDWELALLKLLDNQYFLFDGTFGLESNLETLFTFFEKYKNNGGKYHLIMHGNIGKNLNEVTRLIKKYNLETSVHLTGCLSNSLHESLYNHAKGWIFCWWYYIGKTNISLAKSKNLPLILSDIPAFALYPEAIKIHPNYPESLDTILYHLEKGETFNLPDPLKIDENTILTRYKNILHNNHHLTK